MGIKLVLPHGGYGLGNDLVPWAKAYILSNELGARLLHPAWETIHGDMAGIFEQAGWTGSFTEYCVSVFRTIDSAKKIMKTLEKTISWRRVESLLS